MAGIVASTLRRKAFHKRQPGDYRHPQYDVSHLTSHSPAQSPHDSKASTPSRSDRDDVRQMRSFPSPATRGAKLCLVDFWPACTTPGEQNIVLAKFETFDTLIPKANTWLLENPRARLMKCETLERKIASLDHLQSHDVIFRAIDQRAIYVKGLRLWYVNVAYDDRNLPTEIGYMNVIPKCIDWSGKYPEYENLPDTYSAIDAYLSQTPLEGKIVTIETLPIKLSVCPQKKPEINPDQTCFVDEFLRHILYVTRIYFRYGAPEEELIGAQDFLPDLEEPSRWVKLGPQYKNLSSALKKVKDWLKNCRFISITNIQTLEAEFKKPPESCVKVRFVRVTYVRTDDPNNTDTKPRPRDQLPGFSYRTFTPAPVKVAMCSGAPEYEPFSHTWERAKIWIACVNRRVISVESVVHPLTYLWHNQDGGESTVMHGDWTSSRRNNNHRGHQRAFVCIVRVYLDGDYQEPPQMHIPPIPMVEEVKDCMCAIT